MLLIFCFFFFKQKTAYEMRISDWSSDVCSSDLLKAALAYYKSLGVIATGVMTDNGACYKSHAFRDTCKALGLKHIRTKPYTPKTNGKAERRSEEHTSELKPLMRTSYAVFCLHKKYSYNHINNPNK